MFHEFRWRHSRDFLERTKEGGAGGEASHFCNFINCKILCNALPEEVLRVFNPFGRSQFGKGCFQEIVEALGDMVLRNFQSRYQFCQRKILFQVGLLIVE